MEIIAGFPAQLCQMNVCESRAGAGKVPPVTFAKATVQLCLLVTLGSSGCARQHTPSIRAVAFGRWGKGGGGERERVLSSNLS